MAIFSFIWGLIRFGLTILRGGLPLPYPVALALKLVQYFLIADITILFCEYKSDTLELDLILSGLILVMYFIGKTQNLRSRFMVIQVQSRGLTPQVYKPKMALEFGVIGLSLALFIFLAINPTYAINPASSWFYRNIIEIEKAPIFGFIFQVVGFFFTVNILFRMISSFTMLLSGKAFEKPEDNGNDLPNDDHFDEYEEVDPKN